MGQVTQSIHEFRTFGRNMRLTRERDPASANGGGSSSWPELPGTTQWHDFDGDEAYADSGVSVSGSGPVTLTALAAREPGLGMKDMQTGNTSYFHGDQIGSLRAVTDTPAGVPSVTGRVVYTAFGERVWSNGTIGTRHQYAGAWGYDTMPEFASGMSPHFGGEPGDEVPFVHVGHRWYDPATGRFLQRDPIGIVGGINLYVYTANKPVLAIDPSGLTWIGDGLGNSLKELGDAAMTFGGNACVVALVVPATPDVKAAIGAFGGTAGTAGFVASNVGKGICWLDKKYEDTFIEKDPPRPPSPPPPGPLVPPGPSKTRTYWERIPPPELQGQ